jgi:hypothetical protein
MMDYGEQHDWHVWDWALYRGVMRGMVQRTDFIREWLRSNG